MIEVEKKFQPTEEQLKAMLEGAEFLGEVVNHDAYYDYPDFRLFKKGVKFRKRNENFEIKIDLSDVSAKEIEDREEIKKNFNTENLEMFIQENLIVLTDYEQARKKYTKEGFKIDVDTLNFGISSCDIEVLVEKEEEIKEAEDKIINFAKRYFSY